MDSFLQIINKNKIHDCKEMQYIYDYFRSDSERSMAENHINIGSGLNCAMECRLYDIIQSLSVYISDIGEMECGLALGFSTGEIPKNLAEEIAFCFMEKQIKTHIFEKDCPALELSFAMRKLGCVAGIYIEEKTGLSAYMEYKIFKRNSEKYFKISDFDVLRMIDKRKSFFGKKIKIKNRLYRQIGKDMDEMYVNELHKMVREKDSLSAMKELVNWVIYNECISFR